MATALPKELNTHRPITPIVGRQLLEIVTAGMYSDPRMVYREFIQNAADGIDVAEEAGILSRGAGQIHISIEGERRLVIIEDNGTGIPNEHVEERLGSLGSSIKEGSLQRGFRGIGRLGGLAHCDLLRFETRSHNREQVAVVDWDGRALKTSIQGPKRETLTEIVRRIARVSFRAPTPQDPDHFFRAKMVNVHRFHADLLMNLEAVRGYLSQEAPVPFEASHFSFASEISEYLAALPGFRTYRVTVNDVPVLRPYADTFRINESTTDEIQGVETFEFKSIDGTMLARGWFAKTRLLASLPRRCTMRGIRVRQGNISIGDEYLLEDVFSERRFATWHIGSIEVGPQLRPNARRDGFEETATYETFLEKAAALGRHLSRQCRQQSKERVSQVSMEKKLALIEVALGLDFFVDDAHRAATLKDFRKHLSDLAAIGERHGLNGNFHARLHSLTRKLDRFEGETPLLEACLDGRKIQRLDSYELLRRICKTIVEMRPCGEHNHRIMRKVVEPFLKLKG